MTREEFNRYLKKNNCSITPVDGGNITGQSVRIVNKQFPSQYTYLRMLPINDWDLPDIVIIDTCEQLSIPCPPELNDDEF